MIDYEGICNEKNNIDVEESDNNSRAWRFVGMAAT
jgi:hypothetical protein